jgi:hypothetical protein
MRILKKRGLCGGLKMTVMLNLMVLSLLAGCDNDHTSTVYCSKSNDACGTSVNGVVYYWSAKEAK